MLILAVDTHCILDFFFFFFLVYDKILTDHFPK